MFLVYKEVINAAYDELLLYISRSCTYTPALCRNFWHLVKYANLVIRSNYSTNKVFNFNPRLGFLFKIKYFENFPNFSLDIL